MLQIVLIIIGVVVILLLALLLTRKGRQVVKNGLESVAGICAVALEKTAQKEQNKTKIIEALKIKGKLSNFDIREMLGVSERSVVRYMDELEGEGKVEQVGTVGQAVTYRLKQ